MSRIQTVLAAVVATVAGVLGGAVVQAAAAAPAPAPHWTWPLHPRPEVVRPFEPPESPWGPGHRGVDLAGRVGQQVLAIGDGTVSFASGLAGRGVVVVRHGALRSTYEPVTALVHLGEQVRAGQPIGLLQRVGSHCLPRACLHLGVKRADHYLDPLDLLGGLPVRLKPLAGLVGQAVAPPQGSPPGPGSARSGTAAAGAMPAPGDSGPDLVSPAGAGAATVVGGALLAGFLTRRRQARG